MNGMLSIVQSITAGNCLEQLPQMLAMLDEHQSFRLKPHYELEPIVSHISNLLNDSATKLQGLLLLNSFLPQCPLDIFEQKGALWITLSTKVLVQRKPHSTVSLALCVLSKLFRKTVYIPELTKAMSNTLLSKILENLRLLPVDNHPEALILLEEALRLFPGAAGITKITTEKFLLSFVDSDNAGTVKQSARCLHLLQQTRGGGTQSAAHKIAWSNLHLALIGSLHELLDGIYSSTSELVDSFGGTERLLLPDLVLSDEPVVRTVQLVTRFKNLVTFLQVALLESFPVSKAIQPSKILGLIARGLAVNCDTLGSNAIIDNIVVGSLLPVIHIRLLELLQALISSLRSNMLTYREVVFQLVLQSLKWTASGRAAGTQRPFTNIRIAAYKTLNVWCQVTSFASGVEHCIDDLTEQILQDVTPFQNEVTLKVMSGATKHMSKKARRNMNRAQNDTTNLAQTHATATNAAHNVKLIHTEEGNQVLCAMALKCLTMVVLVAGIFLKPVMHKLFQEHIVKLSIQVVTAAQQPSPTQLYGLGECRSLLYGLLHVLVTAAHPLSPPPLQYAVRLFAIAAVRDANPSVRQDCNQFVRSLEKILHPQKETLQFPAELGEVKDALKELRQLIGKLAPNDDPEEESTDEDEIIVIPTNGNVEAAKVPLLEEAIIISTIDALEIISPPATTTDSTQKADSVADQASDDCNSISSDNDEPEALSAPSVSTESTQKPTSDAVDPRIVWTEDLDDEDTLAVSDDEAAIGQPKPPTSSDEVVEIEDDTLNVGPVAGQKRSRDVTIDISDDEEKSTVSQPRRSKRTKDVYVDEDATLAGVLATFNDEINVDFIEL